MNDQIEVDIVPHASCDNGLQPHGDYRTHAISEQTALAQKSIKNDWMQLDGNVVRHVRSSTFSKVSQRFS